MLYLEPIIPKLSVHYWMQTEQKERQPEEIEVLEKRIQTSRIANCCGIRNIRTFRFKIFCMLDVGDVIELNQSIERSTNL